MSDAIHNLGRQLTALASQAHQAAKSEVDDIIQHGDRDADRIEHLLDHMLGFCDDSAMLDQFKRLYRYYFNINPVATADYVHHYRDMWDTPDADGGQGCGTEYADPAKAGRAGV